VAGTDPAFQAALAAVERAKEALVEAVPSPRGRPRRPLAEALAGFEEALTNASGTLERWDDPRAPAIRAAVGDALGRAERLRLDDPSLDYEGLVTVLGDLMEPLEAFAEGQPSMRRWPSSSSGTS
jgi:hypothetical protein